MCVTSFRSEFCVGEKVRTAQLSHSQGQALWSPVSIRLLDSGYLKILGQLSQDLGCIPDKPMLR